MTEENYKLFEERVKKHFRLFEGKDPTSIPWVVLVDGIRVSMQNGKSLWKQKNHAKCAVTNNIQYVNGFSYYTTPGTLSSKEIKEIKKKWIEEHVEVITLEEWNKRVSYFNKITKGARTLYLKNFE